MACVSVLRKSLQIDMPIDPANIRKDFPQLADADYHFLDTAASSLTPQVVLDAVDEYYRYHRANVHRGMYREAADASLLYEKARGDVAAFIGAFADEIIFSSGATQASNMLVRSLDESLEWKAGDEIVTTVMEHHSSSLPLQAFAKRKGLTMKHIGITDEFSLNYDEAARFITPKTKVVAVMLASNVIGTINDIARIAALTHAVGALMIVDATAAIGHTLIDVRKLSADMLYFSGHKLLAPTGVGVLWMKHDLHGKLSPSEFGGHMVEEVTLAGSVYAPAPAKFEAGTKDIGGVIGLARAVEYLSDIGIDKVHTHSTELVSYAIAQLKQIEGVKVYAMEDPEQNIGIVSFTASWAHPHDIAEILARDQVAVCFRVLLKAESIGVSFFQIISRKQKIVNFRMERGQGQ
jgi:cysteine desulfurase/selenocysteine lyase